MLKHNGSDISLWVIFSFAQGCVTVVTLSLILQYVDHYPPKLKGKGGSGKLLCQVRGTVRGKCD